MNAGGAGDGARFQGLDLLATAVLVLDRRGRIVFANQAAEQLCETSRARLIGQPAHRLFAGEPTIEPLLAEAAAGALGEKRQIIELRRAQREPLALQATASVLDSDETPLLIEMNEIGQQLKIERDERQLDLADASRQMLRNLAHEIKNPLGGIRGAAQLLAAELDEPGQREYTGVIIDEADRLQALVDRLLAPHRRPREVVRFNVHEVCERVRFVMSAEFAHGLEFVRDYDASVPEIEADREQLIQALLNIVRNAAEALAARIAAGDARIILRTRVARHVTIARRHARLALDLRVIDNGPGIAQELRDRVFYPLVSGRAGGSGLGLTLAQGLVQQNDGAIEFESRPGQTDFRILLPLPANGHGPH